MQHDHSGHEHDHSGHHHDHHDHNHDHAAHAPKSRVLIAAILTFTFMIAEVAGGLISGSLALLADAAHMLTDAGSLALAYIGYILAERPADQKRTFGFSRFRILAAFANGLLLILLALWIFGEAIERLISPGEILSGILLWIAVGGLVVNVVAFFVLHGGDQEDLNLSAALWHVVGDLLGSVAAIICAIIIMTTGWTPIDPILSALIAGLVGWAGWRIMKKSAHILLEGTPTGLDPEVIGTDLEANIADVERAHHIHVWSLTGTDRKATLQIRLSDSVEDPLSVTQAVKQRLGEHHGIEHTTVEIDCEDAENPVDTCGQTPIATS